MLPLPAAAPGWMDQLLPSRRFVRCLCDSGDPGAHVGSVGGQAGSVVRPGTQTVWTERAGVRRLASLPRAVLVRCAGVDVARARVRGAPVIPVAAALRLAFVVSVVWGAPTGIRLGWVQVRRWASALEESNYTAITPDEGAYAFEALLRHNRVYTGYAPVIGAPWLVAFAERSRFFEVFSSSNGSGTSKFRVELNELPRDEWPARLRQLVAEQVSLILRRTVDPDRPLPEYGLDSLGALELRTRIETETGIRLAPKNVSATVRGLADHLYEQLAPDDAPAAALSSQ